MLQGVSGLYYLLAWNTCTFILTVYDKYASRNSLGRVSEKHLITAAFFLGAPGVYLGMQMARHKTRKPVFRYGLPVLIMLNGLAVFLLAGTRLL